MPTRRGREPSSGSSARAAAKPPPKSKPYSAKYCRKPAPTERTGAKLAKPPGRRGGGDGRTQTIGGRIEDCRRGEPGSGKEIRLRRQGRGRRDDGGRGTEPETG